MTQSRGLGFWWVNSRPQSLPQSVTPALLVMFLAIGQPGFTWWLALLAVVAVALAHLSMNLFDDYFDYKKIQANYRDDMASSGERARTMKCPYITSGQATLQDLLHVSVGLLVATGVLAVVILVFRGWPILIYMALLALLGLSYSGGPLKLGYRGFGELVIGALFGPLAMTGVFFAACGAITVEAVVIGVGVGALVVNIVYAHSILDIRADRKAGKTTLAGLIGNRKAMLAVFVALYCLAYACVIVLVALGLSTPWMLLSLATLPWAAEVIRSIAEFLRNPDAEVKRKRWAGPMGDWDNYCAMGLAWFMYRWMLARNIAMFFCFACMIACVLDLVQRAMVISSFASWIW